MRPAYAYLLLQAVIPIAVFQSSHAHDHMNLERGIPVQIEDAYPTSYMNREFQGITRTTRNDRGEQVYELVPVLEYGFIRNGELELSVPVRLLPGENRNSGNVELEALYNFNFEGLILPAFALKGGVEIPSGIESRGWDPQATLLITKTLSRSSWFHVLHFNASLLYNGVREASERSSRYRLTLGYELRLGPNNMLLFDVQREQREEAGQGANLLEVGLRHQWNPLTVLALGAGAGIGEESLDCAPALDSSGSDFYGLG